MIAEKRHVKLGASVLEDKSQVAVATALEEFASQLADTQTAVNMRLAETVDQITKRKQVLYPLVFRQVPQATNNRGIDGEKLIQAACEGLDRRWW